MSGAAEVEIPRPEAGEEVDVGEPTVIVADRSHSQFHDRWKNSQFPQFEWVDHQAQGTRSGVGSRASETNTDDSEVKRVTVAESRGQKKAR